MYIAVTFHVLFHVQCAEEAVTVNIIEDVPCDCVQESDIGLQGKCHK